MDEDLQEINYEVNDGGDNIDSLDVGAFFFAVVLAFFSAAAKAQEIGFAPAPSPDRKLSAALLRGVILYCNPNKHNNSHSPTSQTTKNSLLLSVKAFFFAVVLAFFSAAAKAQEIGFAPAPSPDRKLSAALLRLIWFCLR
nr:hypothetical protein Iba_chr08fCG2670 [Ipomoea batatas]